VRICTKSGKYTGDVFVTEWERKEASAGAEFVFGESELAMTTELGPERSKRVVYQQKRGRRVAESGQGGGHMFKIRGGA